MIIDPTSIDSSLAPILHSITGLMVFILITIIASRFTVHDRRVDIDPNELKYLFSFWSWNLYSKKSQPTECGCGDCQIPTGGCGSKDSSFDSCDGPDCDCSL